MTFEIENNIPVSADKQGRQRLKWEKPDFPFSKLFVGQSFRVERLPGLTLIETQNRVSGAACCYRKKRAPGSWNFTTRQVAGEFVRCWRTA